MDKLELSPEARRCLWRGYSLLLRLAEEADENTLEETELDEANETVRTMKACRLTQPNNDSSEAKPEPVLRAK
jgi:phytoene/squalene synthetase